MSQSVCVYSIIILALVAATVVAITIPCVQTDTCDACECKLSNVEILSRLIDQRINASLSTSVDAEVTAIIIM